ncbi:hypothetical protein AB1Y20_013001 [Prymnesium parvum]|uniref:M23ase beta-sheet core domain-containing protein n=1 Tax=Prymnesium parvum TaxID=97485 RepID=A0AB34IM59_PRYPA
MEMMIPGRGPFAGIDFAPIVPGLYRAPYLVRDFTQGLEALPALADTGYAHDVGRYNERRRAMYTSDLFGQADPWAKPAEVREIHIGVDVGGPVGTPVHSIADCTVHSCGYNAAPLDYGHVVVTEQTLNGRRVWALYGHLDAASTAGKKRGDTIARGAVLGAMGDKHENGGWPSHVHFQLSLVEPETHDMPGVVSNEQHKEALERYPDPLLVMGPLYPNEGFFE